MSHKYTGANDHKNFRVQSTSLTLKQNNTELEAAMVVVSPGGISAMTC